MLLWCMQDGSIGFENEEDGNCKFIYQSENNGYRGRLFIKIQ